MDALFNPMAMSVLASVVMLLVLASLARHPVPGVPSWLSGCAILVAAQCAYATRGSTSPLFNMVFANSAFLVGMLLLLAGCLRFFDRPVPYRLFLIGLVLTTLYNLGPWIGYDRPDHRVVVFSLTHAVVCATIAIITWRYRPRGRPAYSYGLCSAVAIGMVLGYAGRTAYYATMPDPANAGMLTGGIPGLFITLGVVGTAALVMSLIVIAHDRLLADIEALAYRDHLTGAASRLAFLQRLSQVLAPPVMAPPAMTLLLMDLDHFKAINDSHGHAAGDTALIHFTRLARACLREGDILGRLGGEEFAVLMPDSTAADAIALDARLRGALTAHPARFDQAELRHGFSSGLAMAEPGDTAERLISRADAALYRAKHGGRGRLERATPAISTGVLETA